MLEGGSYNVYTNESWTQLGVKGKMCLMSCSTFITYLLEIQVIERVVNIQ